MLAACTTGKRSVGPAAVRAMAVSRPASRAFSDKADKPVPSPEEEEAKKAAQMRALETVLEAKNHTGKPEFATR